jgi:hypothetical protein
MHLETHAFPERIKSVPVHFGGENVPVHFLPPKVYQYILGGNCTSTFISLVTYY